MAITLEPAEHSRKPDCFVIMPISDQDGYGPGHFTRVYEDLIKPACTAAGFKAKRADDVRRTNLIQLDILKSLIDSPMAVCDLSSANPNVMFELALRQAFDKPVALIQEKGTREIFDISGFRYTEYRRERLYHEVLADQKEIAKTIQETYRAASDETNVNSIVKLLALAKASLPETSPEKQNLEFNKLIVNELKQLKSEIRDLASGDRVIPHHYLEAAMESELDHYSHHLKLAAQAALDESPETIKAAIKRVTQVRRDLTDLALRANSARLGAQVSELCRLSDGIGETLHTALAVLQRSADSADLSEGEVGREERTSPQPSPRKRTQK